MYRGPGVSRLFGRCRACLGRLRGGDDATFICLDDEGVAGSIFSGGRESHVHFFSIPAQQFGDVFYSVAVVCVTFIGWAVFNFKKPDVCTVGQICLREGYVEIFVIA